MARESKGEVRSCRDCWEQSRRVGVLELVKIAGAKAHAEFLMPHLLSIGSSGPSFTAGRSSYNPELEYQRNSLMGALPAALKVNFAKAQSLKIAFLQREVGKKSGIVGQEMW